MNANEILYVGLGTKQYSLRFSRKTNSTTKLIHDIGFIIKTFELDDVHVSDFSGRDNTFTFYLHYTYLDSLRTFAEIFSNKLCSDYNIFDRDIIIY